MSGKASKGERRAINLHTQLFLNNRDRHIEQMLFMLFSQHAPLARLNRCVDNRHGNARGLASGHTHTKAFLNAANGQLAQAVFDGMQLLQIALERQRHHHVFAGALNGKLNMVCQCNGKVRAQFVRKLSGRDIDQLSRKLQHLGIDLIDKRQVL